MNVNTVTVSAAPTQAQSRGSRAKHLFRIATLVVPSWLAWYVAFSAKHPDDMIRTVTYALGPLWALLAGSLALRIAVLIAAPNKAEQQQQQQEQQESSTTHLEKRTTFLAQIDVLTSSGTALAWLSAFAIMGAVWIGFASLAVVGLLGTALFHIVVLYTFAVLRAGDPMGGRGSLSRRFSPEVVTEGDDVVEELRFSGTRIPIGFRLFVTGRVGPRWATCRHVLDAAESGAEVELESDVGPAVRGEQEPELLEVWLEDTFGLCQSMRVQVGSANLTVLPRLRKVDKAIAPLLNHGLGEHAPRPNGRLPTEGLFHLREYQQGDDVRRIHWVRSVAAGELIVRLPDEIPPDQPRVRLVLDTFFPEAFALSCDAPSEMLDAIVATWIAVARTLVDSGIRVTLVTTLPRKNGDGFATTRHNLMPRDPNLGAVALRIGAQVVWQNRVAVDELLTDEATFVVSRGVLVAPPTSGKVRWIIVLPTMSTEMHWPSQSAARLPYPMGSSENRWSHRREVMSELVRKRADHAKAMLAMRTNVASPPKGSFAAFTTTDGTIRLEALQ